MATISEQRSRRSGASATYATKDGVVTSALNAPAQASRFEARLQQIREIHGKAGVRPMQEVDERGKLVRDEAGQPVIARDEQGNTLYESKYVQSYNLVQSFGHDELDPDDPDSWERANELGRAIAADRAPGHPALVVTEINGRSGMVHNHIIIGAVHPETGKSIDSDVFTPSRMAVAHDRVLEENGFEQREDMRDITRSVEAQMEERRQQVLDEAPKDISTAKLNKQLIAAEKSVELRAGAQAKDPRQKQQERAQREFERYQLNEQTRSAAEHLDAPGPKERFSEIELQGRVRETLADQRATNWQRLDEVGQERGVEVTRRGKDVSYGMMLADEDGVVQEPARAHKRRGSRLGEGYRVEDVEAALERNRELAQTKTASFTAPDHQQAMKRAARDVQRELLAEHGDLLEQKSVEPAAVEAPAEAAEESPAERERRELREAAAEAAEREAKELEEFRAWEAEQERKSREQYEQLMANAPAEPEAPEVEAPEAPQVETEEPQRIEHEAEQPQVSESKWSRLKERDAERAAPEPVQEQREAKKPRRAPGQEKQVIRLSGAEREDREVLAVATENADGTAYVDWQLAHHDPAARDRQGLHLMAKEGKVGRRKLTTEQHKHLKEVAGENRTEVEGKQVLAARTNLRPHGESYAASLKALKPSEQKVGADVLDKQRESEDRARQQSAEQSREADHRAQQRLVAKESSLQVTPGRESRGPER